MKRAATIFITALGLLLSVFVVTAPDAKAADSADECVRMRETQEVGEKSGLTLSVDNNCDRRLACSVAWTVQCESATGKVTRRSKESARFVVGSSSSQGAFASAKTCGDNWKIEEVSWDCAVVK